MLFTGPSGPSKLYEDGSYSSTPVMSHGHFLSRALISAGPSSSRLGSDSMRKSQPRPPPHTPGPTARISEQQIPPGYTFPGGPGRRRSTCFSQECSSPPSQPSKLLLSLHGPNSHTHSGQVSLGCPGGQDPCLCASPRGRTEGKLDSAGL